MSEKNPVTYVFISQDDIRRIYRGCDLGDSVKVNVYQYPHKDQIPYLDCFVLQSTYDSQSQLIKEKDQRIEELEKLLDQASDCANDGYVPSEDWIDRAMNAIAKGDGDELYSNGSSFS